MDLLITSELAKRHGQEVPTSVYQQNAKPVTSGQTSFGGILWLHQHGQSGIWLSENLPHLSKVS
jgi:hypothetical protein